MSATSTGPAPPTMPPPDAPRPLGLPPAGPGPTPPRASPHPPPASATLWRQLLRSAALQAAATTCTLALVSGLALLGLGALAATGLARVVAVPARPGDPVAAVAFERRLGSDRAGGGDLVFLPHTLTADRSRWYAEEVTAGWKPLGVLAGGAGTLAALGTVWGWAATAAVTASAVAGSSVVDRARRSGSHGATPGWGPRTWRHPRRPGRHRHPPIG